MSERQAGDPPTDRYSALLDIADEMQIVHRDNAGFARRIRVWVNGQVMYERLAKETND